MLQDLAGIFDAEGAFTGLGWRDARRVPAVVSFDCCTEDHAEVVLADRARAVAAGGDGYRWCDRAAVAHAPTVTAAILGTW